MKLPAIIKRDTAAALAKANEDLLAIDAEIVSLQAEYAAKLASAEPAELERLDQRMDDRCRAAGVRRDRIVDLEQLVAQEQAEQREDQFRQAVAAIEGPLARRTEAAVELERALTAVGVAAKQFALTTENVLKAWPGGVDFPPTAYPGHLLSLGRMGQLIESVFVGFEIFHPRTKVRVSASEFAARAIDVAERVRLAAFAATEKQIAEEWLADLRTAHDPPQPAEPETKEEAA
jgi:hypothetical protein